MASNVKVTTKVLERPNDLTYAQESILDTASYVTGRPVTDLDAALRIVEAYNQSMANAASFGGLL
jgi:hypothetical protein